LNFYPLIKPLLFNFDPEKVHNYSIHVAERAGRSKATQWCLSALYGFRDPVLESRVAGMHLPTPVGLAAGFDKNGRAVEVTARLGFGFIEIGSVSADCSCGNPTPRLFRLPEDQAIIVNYGVPNEGARRISERLRGYSHYAPLGVNIVETNSGRVAGPDEVIGQFITAAKAFVGCADYLTLNLACPNTSAETSVFHDARVLDELLAAYDEIFDLPPVFPKLSASIEEHRIGKFVEVITKHECIAGYIFNLPPGKNFPLRISPDLLGNMPGTLCGMPAREMMTNTIRNWYRRIDREKHVIIGSGGIFSATDAYEKIRHGASVVQLYTAMIYEGPSLIRKINKELAGLLKRDGFNHIGEAVGIDVS